MRHLLIVFVATVLLTPGLAVEHPTYNQDRGNYPIATIQGIDNLRLGAPLPNQCSFPGLSFKTTSAMDYDALGQLVTRTTIKIYFRGFFVGHGLVDQQKRLVELELTDWRIAFEGRFAANSTWQRVRSELTDLKLHYADMLAAVVAESPELPGLQVHFSPSSYRVKRDLKGDFSKLSSDQLPSTARAEKLRLFWIPSE